MDTKSFYNKRYKKIVGEINIEEPLRDLGDLVRIFVISKIFKKKSFGDNVLDVGCGCGATSIHVLSHHREIKKYVGVDISDVAISIAKQRFNDAPFESNFLCEEIENISLESGSIDTVLLIETLEHIYNDNELIRNIHRMLKPSGILIVSTPNAKPFPGSFNYFQLKLRGKFLKDESVGHLRRYDSQDLFRLFINCNLKPLYVASYGHLCLGYLDKINKQLYKSKIGNTWIYKHLLFNVEYYLCIMDSYKKNINFSDGLIVVARK